MKFLHGLEAVTPPLPRSVLTVGNFDGVHRAHQKLVEQARTCAASPDIPVVVLTFDPHPLSVVTPDRAPARLYPMEEKLRRLEAVGADIVVVAHSDPALLGLTAERFVLDVLQQRFHPTHIVEGPSFGFGRGRAGTPELLRRLAAGFDCEVQIVDPVTLWIDEDELLVSSSLIRRLLTVGKARHAAACLGCPYPLFGEVVQGDRRGRTIGFPTANLEPGDQLVPADGVYAGKAVVDDVAHSCAISIGTTPTFDGTARRIEAHLLDFDGDLYGKQMRLEFERFLRAQRAFPSADALTEQLRRDVARVGTDSTKARPDPAAADPEAEGA